MLRGLDTGHLRWSERPDGDLLLVPGAEVVHYPPGRPQRRGVPLEHTGHRTHAPGPRARQKPIGLDQGVEVGRAALPRLGDGLGQRSEERVRRDGVQGGAVGLVGVRSQRVGAMDLVQRGQHHGEVRHARHRLQSYRGHPHLGRSDLGQQRAEHARPRRFPRREQLRLGAASVLGDAVQVDDDGPVSEVGCHGPDVDAVHDQHAPEREHRQSVIGVQLAPHVSVAGHGAAQGVGQPRLNRAYFVGGYAGSGKSETARVISRITGAPVVDKDTITRAVVEGALEAMGRPPHDRESETYLQHVRPREYECLNATVLENAALGIGVVGTAPYVAEFGDRAWIDRSRDQLSAYGIGLTLVWVSTDVETMHTYLRRRGAARDTVKLANWSDYLKERIDVDFRPVDEHVVIHNSADSEPLQSQVTRMLAEVAPRS